MRIGYGKVGRSMPLTLDACGTVGGDVECVAVVKDLALRHPDDTFVLIGRNSGERPKDVGLPENIENPWTAWQPRLREELNARAYNHPSLSIEEELGIVGIYNEMITPTFLGLDGIVLWLGQHGSSNSPLPATGAAAAAMTKPHDWEVYYCAYLFHGVNAWRNVDPVNREEVWLNADARNYHKMRDLKWPWRHPILAQFDFPHKTKHYRYGDDSPIPEAFKSTLARRLEACLWEAEYKYKYSRLEICSLSPTAPHGSMATFNDRWEGRQHFGIFINEARPMTKKPELVRGPILKRWVLPLEPAFIHGKWSFEGQMELSRTIQVAPWEDYFPFLHTVRATFTTPSSGSGWATTKPWEAFAAGTVCFFHPAYDSQNHILKDAPPPLKAFLRVDFPGQLADRVKKLGEDRALWEDMVAMQRAHFSVAITKLDYLREIEGRIWR